MDNFLKRSPYLTLFQIIVLIILLFQVEIVIGGEKPSINILSWWGYLNYPDIINETEKACDVKLSFDEYYSNSEFLRRWGSNQEYYDIIIFSDIIYNVVKKKIPRFKNNVLYQQSKNYNKIIKDHYIKAKYPANVVYFTHALRCFLWNPANITLDSSDSVASIFFKAKNNYVVITDDPIETAKLFSFSINGQNMKLHKALSIENFKKVMQSSKIYITNNYSQIYNKNKFAFSFTWSGEAMVGLMKSNKKYRLLIHPKLSYITSDLLAQTSNKKGAYCVAKFLSSRRSMALLQKNDFYFSPYADKEGITNLDYIYLYKQFIMALSFVEWGNPPNDIDYQKNNKLWQAIKISTIKDVF